MVYEPLARTADVTDEQRKLAAMCREIFEHCQAGWFGNCIAAINEKEQAFGPSKLAKLYRDACDKYIMERAPDGFCGQIVLSEKRMSCQHPRFVLLCRLQSPSLLDAV